MTGLVAYKVGHTPLKDDTAAKAFTSPDLDNLTEDLHTTITLDDLVGFHVEGECPRCTHDTQDVFALAMFDGSSVGEAPPGVDAGDDASTKTAKVEKLAAFRNDRLVATKVVGAGVKPQSSEPPQVFAVLRCNCVRNHSKSPAGFGCGTSWLIGATFDLSKGHGEKVAFFKPSRAQEAEYWQEADSISSDAKTSLQTVQTSAKNWQAAFASIIALVSVASVIAGRDAIQGLADPARYVVFFLAALTIVAEAVALYLATLANLGFPSLTHLTNLKSERLLDLNPLKQAGDAGRRLRAAVVLTLSSILLALGALGVFVLAPSAVTNPVTITFIAHSTYGDGDSVCGELLASSPSKVVKGKDAGQIIMKVDDKTMHYNRSQIAKITPGPC